MLLISLLLCTLLSGLLLLGAAAVVYLHDKENKALALIMGTFGWFLVAAGVAAVLWLGQSSLP